MFYFISSGINILFSCQFCIIIVLVPTVTKVLLFKFHFNLFAFYFFSSRINIFFFSILYNNCKLRVLFCLNCFEVPETLIIGIVFIFMLLIQINQTYLINRINRKLN